MFRKFISRSASAGPAFQRRAFSLTESKASSLMHRQKHFLPMCTLPQLSANSFSSSFSGLSNRSFSTSPPIDELVKKKTAAWRREVAILAEAFFKYDENNTGALSQDAISRLLDATGLPDDCTINDIFRTLDANNDNMIQLDEWLDNIPLNARMHIVDRLSMQTGDRPSAHGHRNVRIVIPKEQAKIIYTLTDEAPMFATYSLLPIVRAFTKSSGVQVDLADISVAGRILANFPHYLTDEQRQRDELAELGKLCKTPQANVIKLPNVSASIPQLTDAIAELQSKGYSVPDYPANPSNDEEVAINARYAKVLGSAVNPVLREGNSDRRVAGPVKSYAQKHPVRLKEWSENSQTHVAYMNDGDFFSTEQSTYMTGPTAVRIQLVHAPGAKSMADGVTTTVLKARTTLRQGEVIDAAVMRAEKLRQFFKEQIEQSKDQNLLLSLHLKATMMKVSDPIMFGHAVEVFFEPLFAKHGELFKELGVNSNNGFEDVLIKVATLPESDPRRQEIEADIQACYDNGPSLAMVDSRKGITNLHVPNNVIIDASMPPAIRDGGKMWNANDELEDTKMLIPDRSYATMYQAIVEDCQEHGPFDVSTMGNVSNVGLMAQKAEEYGSHDKTFEIANQGIVQVVDNITGEIIFQHDVNQGDIWRMCQTKDSPIQDWVQLAVARARATGNPAYFWLNSERAHDRVLIEKVENYLQAHDTDGLDIQILPPEQAMKATLKRVRNGEDTISVTGNVLRDYLTDLFPILELGTSAKMLSIVPLLAGGGLFETGAGGSAPKHVQQLESEGHLRWDSLGEFLALAVSMEDLADKSDNPRARVLAQCLDRATGKLLDTGKSPSRKVNELDNRGSHFYLALYWAEELAGQSEDADLAAEFQPIAEKLAQNEDTIVTELNSAQGEPVDLSGYYMPNPDRCTEIMRPSSTFNTIIDGI